MHKVYKSMDQRPKVYNSKKLIRTVTLNYVSCTGKLLSKVPKTTTNVLLIVP